MEKLGAGLVLTILGSVCAGCGPSAPTAPEKVPIELVPDGFTQDDCHYVEPQHVNDGGLGGQGTGGGGLGSGGLSNAASASVSKKATERHISCHHSDELVHPEKPDSAPTSGEPPRHCGDDDGLIRRCADEG